MNAEFACTSSPWDFPSFSMTAGETKQLRLPICDSNHVLVDVAGMDGKLAFSDFVTPAASLFSVSCQPVFDQECGGHIFVATLPPVLTVDLCGKYIYQLTARGIDGALGVLRGTVIVHRNADKQSVYDLIKGDNHDN